MYMEDFGDFDEHECDGCFRVYPRPFDERNWRCPRCGEPFVDEEVKVVGTGVRHKERDMSDDVLPTMRTLIKLGDVRVDIWSTGDIGIEDDTGGYIVIPKDKVVDLARHLTQYSQRVSINRVRSTADLYNGLIKGGKWYKLSFYNSITSEFGFVLDNGYEFTDHRNNPDHLVDGAKWEFE